MVSGDSTIANGTVFSSLATFWEFLRVCWGCFDGRGFVRCLKLGGMCAGRIDVVWLSLGDFLDGLGAVFGSFLGMIWFGILFILLFGLTCSGELLKEMVEFDSLLDRVNIIVAQDTSVSGLQRQRSAGVPLRTM